MKLVYLIVTLMNIILIKTEDKIIPKEIIESTFTTRLNHFHPHDSRTAIFNYNANFKYYKSGGPFYINLKDAGDHSIRWIENGLMVDIARNTSGALFTFDCRYTGNNIPTETATINDLQFLSYDQILADLATFIRQINIKYMPENSVIITYGIGYGGVLSAFGRSKYPHLINAAWSSSGVIGFNIETILTSFFLYDTLSTTFQQSTHRYCNIFMGDMFKRIDEELIQQNETERLKEIFNLCQSIDLDSMSDVGNFFIEIIQSFIEYLEENHFPGLQSFCNIMVSAPNDDDRLNSFSRWLNKRHGNKCLDISYTKMINELRNINWNQPGTLSGKRQWSYLQCTQNALFQITDNNTFAFLPNRIELDYYIKKCHDIIDDNDENSYNFDLLAKVNSALYSTFGSQDQQTTKVIYTMGGLDPWRHNMARSANARDSILFEIVSYSKAADFLSIQESDELNLVGIKEYIMERIIGWSKMV